MSNSDVVNDVLWTEKYRPTNLADMAMEDENRRVLESYIEGGVIPHLLFIGPAGSGKTTISRILVKSLNCSVLTLNASAERGIDTIREKVGSFVQAMLLGDWNIVFMDEADQLTSDAQGAMRNMMESYSDRARFIFTGNYGHKIIGPIQSRCQVLVFGRPPLKERYRILASVLQKEGVQSMPPVVLGYAEKYPDLRAMLFAAQRAWLGGNKTVLPPATASGPVSGEELFGALVKKQWTTFPRLTATGDFDVQQAFRELFWAIPVEHPKAGFLRHVISKGVHETAFTPDPIILFLGVISEAMEGL